MVYECGGLLPDKHLKAERQASSCVASRCRSRISLASYCFADEKHSCRAQSVRVSSAYYIIFLLPPQRKPTLTATDDE
ncbi:unnamed protein product [Linum trigynum]|uniref:Uncharacterized protein n=1 Tax=Linum trigynum TaxID=586398 RepID=A0AAV2CHJ8_9ROSI